MTPAIVLAAGASSRMGRPKALLAIAGRTFVRRIVDALHDGGAADVLVVVRADAGDVAAEAIAAGARAIVNADPDRGQLSSLITGLDAADRPEADAVLVTLVDVPLVAASTVAALLARAAATRAPIVRATHGGRHGHPVIFTRAIFPALRAADPAAGAKPVLRAFAIDDVETGDPGVLRDVDTPEDYERLLT